MAATYFTSLDGLSSSGLDSPSTPGADGVSSRRVNALSTKLTSVLSSSFTDYEIRDALRLLDERAVQNDEETRRNLKLDAQKEVIDCDARIVDDFGKVAEQLRRVGAMLTTLNATCAVMREHIQAARQESAPVLEEATTLMSRKEEAETKQALLDAFSTHFLIPTPDLNILTSSVEPLDDRFFAILARVKQIHRDCEILLGYENQRLGLELMEQTTRNLDAGFMKLYNWIQREFKGLDLEDPHISGAIRRALRVLSERPTLFQNCLDFFAEARQSTLAESFHAALTGSAGAAKAIEFSTHEPLRYVGDMLAWVHSAAVSEKEALEGLFVSDADEIAKGLSASKASEPWARIGGGQRRASVSSTTSSSATETEQDVVFDGRKALADLVSRDLASVCEILQSRIDISVRNSGDPVLMFKTVNLLDFYRGIFDKLLGSDSSLSKLIQGLQASSLTRFEATMQEETVAATVDSTPSPDLTPPVFLAMALSQFSEVARARGPQMTQAELERLFGAMLTGILTACTESAAEIPDVHRSTVYKINYMTALRTTLAAISAQVHVVQTPLGKAGEEIQSLRDNLVEILGTTLLEDSGVRDLMQELDTRRSHDAQTRRRWLESNLDEAAQRLDQFLSSSVMDAQESLKNLLDRTLAKDIVAEAVERFCSEFDELESMLEMVDAESGTVAGGDDNAIDHVGALRELYPRTGAEVRALLS
ncbi:Golgi transport complex subunit 6 [Elasticomyces elasticus]|uniref:Conserved oligomeric Golgi complex subunit 6 n=1 Tax=Exophiala sideris TaxID=1016849 RepID=A0ABR0JC05_9EURO|nr:Golgi transport complex subunit 6 [Elasticomyces elasticus]KAK5031213.1 Golgi transport complex subunit 6 [Exophiala sideris]KAK5038934.1 Golgi transport complex subunit 6 [Exophiala sideris]KAK5060818.1 Golgi transport complex subunit 6 [Exophiala sideris]KAK5183730.1 Golgi transport complex subunit 6 [Eurotiomycetes sp. CCFEE 6388]